MTTLKDRSIIVTGAGSGIGRATAQLLAANGARVLAADRDEASVGMTADMIAASGGVAEAIRADVKNDGDVAAMVARAVERFGRLDGAFNNAGVEMSGVPLHELTEAQFRHVVDVNLVGTFLCLKHEIKAMLETGGGAIVNMASTSGVIATARAADYTASKHGVIGLTKAAALDYAQSGIRINAVAPAAIATPMIEERLLGGENFGPLMQMIKAAHPIGRLGKPTEIAEAVLWLLSDASSFVMGTALVVDGGYTAP